MSDYKSSNFTEDTQRKRKNEEEHNKSKGKSYRINSKGHVRPRMYNVSSTAYLDCHIENDQETDNEGNTSDIKDTAADQAAVQIESNIEQRDFPTEDEDVRETVFTDAEIQEEGATDDDDDNWGFFSEYSKKFIYPGHSLTVFNSIMLIWTYALIHGITASQLADLLVLINVHCLENVEVYKSVQKFKNVFAKMKSPMKKHYFCKHCLMSVNIEMNTCPNTFCSKDISGIDSKSYFIEFPIDDQVRCLFKRKSFRDNLNYRFNRKKKQENAIEDIYDGFMYKRLFTNGQPLSDPNNLSFTWNTDGVPVFKSSKYSIWPMYLMINELPYSARKEKANMVFYGLWFGELKPSINLFCKPLHESLKSLETEGITVKFEGKTENVMCLLVCGTADLPARATALNMVQFNGSFSCSRCLQQGKTCKTSLRGHTHVYPYSKDNPAGPARSHDASLKYAVDATESTGEHVKGMKGMTFLLGLKHYDFVLSTSIDYMHCVLLGITKKLISLWFSVSESSELFSLVNKIEFVDGCMSKIKPTFHITRRPRSVSEHFKYWKASEFRAWLFFYSVPILSSIMEPLYFFHYCAFVQSIWLLCQDSISQKDIDVSYSLLNYFVYMFEPLYGARYCGLNMHSLLHLPKCVEDLGPMWVYSCFPFESLNGDLLKLFNGTQHVDTQILSAVNSHQIMPHLLDKLSDNVKEIPFVKKYLGKGKITLGLRLDHNVYVVGTPVKYKISGTLLRSLATHLNLKPLYLSYFSRLKVRNNIVHSESYKRVKERNSFTVKYLDGDNTIQFGFVKIFVVHRLSECTCTGTCTCEKNILAIVTKLKKVKESILDKSQEGYPDYLNLHVGHIHVMKNFQNQVFDITDVHKIVAMCVDVYFSDIHFVCEFSNTIECD